MDFLNFSDEEPETNTSLDDISTDESLFFDFRKKDGNIHLMKKSDTEMFS